MVRIAKFAKRAKLDKIATSDGIMEKMARIAKKNIHLIRQNVVFVDNEKQD